ncbi:MAG: ParB/RepB/Spo0J family partition protein [Rikenellaceae bacterium]|jgi:ParB family chromosome partitioning protein|nr:ParB/RepB/Spo0J family partition protein [Rikenellaceae bacterium]
MSAKQLKGLGRGLDAIFGTEELTAPKAARPMGSIEEIALTAIVPNPKQPRTHFDEEALEELADSIRVLGVIQPVTVRAVGDGTYVIISGERRWRASQLAGLETIPVYVRAVDDQNLHEMALVENIQRQDLNAMEIAFSLSRLMEECGLTQDKLSERVGKKRSSVANYLRLLKLPEQVQLALKEGFITMGHAKAIASAPEEAQLGLLKKTLRRGLSVRQLEALATAQPKATSATEEAEYPESYSRLVELLERFFSDNISIKTSPKGRGKIVIEFDGEGDIERFIGRFEEAK